MKFYCTLTLVICTGLIQAQTIHCKIPIQDIGKSYGQLQIQGLVLNDSIFLAGHSAKKEPTKAVWVLPSGSIVKVESPELKKKLIVALSSSGDSTYFYYLEQSKNYISLRAVVQNRRTGIVITTDKSINFAGSFVNIFHAGNHTYLLSIFKEKNEIHLTELKGMERLNAKFLASPIDLNTDASSFSFVSENETLSPNASSSPNKIYQQNNFIYVGIDKATTIDASLAKTSILKINLETGVSEVGTIVDYSKKQFRTYIKSNYIFKITKSRSNGAVISIYNLHDFTLLQTMQINEAATMAKNRSFKKDFTKTTDKESVWDALSNNAGAFITASSTDSLNFIIRVGSHHFVTRSGAGFIPVLTAFPILAIAGAIARVAALSLSEMESVDHYLYLTWDGKSEPIFSNKPISAVQAIDTYDVDSFKQKRRFEYKGYLHGNSKIFGIYQEAFSKVADVIVFSNP
jgi:hypothetical protein